MDLLLNINHKFDMVFADLPYFLSNNGLSIQRDKIVSINKGKWDKSKKIAKENSKTEYYYEVILKENFTFNKSIQNKLKPKILFDKNDKTYKELLRKYLPTITTKERIVKNTRLNTHL